MPSYELFYFNARGRGEVARMCFHFAGVPFKDSRIAHEEWRSVKGDTSKFPYGQMPSLLIDGKPLTESHAINRFVARVTNLDGGSDPVETAFLDQAYEVFRCFVDETYTFYITALGYAQGDKDQLYKEQFVPAVQKHFPKIIGLLKPNGFFGNKGPSYVDFYVAGYMESFLKQGFAEVNKFPPLVKHLTDVRNIPQLQEYLKNRPDTIS
ncbi:unnamed protein product [Bursaphelenchus xylophilus]|uniref:glutathione transferase n=2 Tax=Bursaphelenchus xylophilus TaxID=6326 RepID=A0A1I7RQK4_BURXY|nr:unnamed protein product [Bursaphelenchus xylophilus]CAG9104735.1 unnamed protein product [Bursaphelenchus xylophilus]